MARILHSADWQLGARLRFVPGDKGAQLRLDRFETLATIAALAKERDVDAVLVSGDVFDDNAVGDDILQQTRDKLSLFSCPVLLISGNHDAATAECALERLNPAGYGLDHVHVLLDTSPLTIGDTTYHPCPLARRHSYEDTCAHLKPVNEAGVHVVLAHGGAHEFSESATSPNLIDVKAIIQKGYDYVALGDWHSPLKIDERAWYSGTHEFYSRRERDPGHVLLVNIAKKGALPQVETLRVGRVNKAHFERIIESGEDVALLAEDMNALEMRSKTIATLSLEGALSMEDYTRLEALITTQSSEMLHLEVKRLEVTSRPSEEELFSLQAPGFLQHALDELLASEAPHAAESARLLYRLIRENAQ